jgi:hypothetical protein
MSEQAFGLYRRDELGGTEWIYRAQEKQKIGHLAAAPNILYGGAAGPGKSHWLRWHLILGCLQFKNFNALLLRRQYTELEDTHIRKIQLEVPAEYAKYNVSKHTLNFPKTNAVLRLGHAKHENDVFQYLSTEWDLIGVDEASQFTPRQLDLLRSRLRTINPDIKPQFCAASNPGGPAHTWLKQRFIDKRVPSLDRGQRYEPEEWLFIPGLLHDNEYIDYETYRAQLEELPQAVREAYLHGNWDSFEGQYFDEWDRNLHVVPAAEQFEITDWWQLGAGMDWGYAPHPGVVIWNAYSPEGQAYAYKELVFERSTPTEVAALIAGRCHTERENNLVIRGDTSMWITQATEGVSIAEMINEELHNLGTNITIVQANKDRINGWMRMHQWLNPRRPIPQGGVGPWLRIFNLNPELGYGCPYLIETLPLQLHVDSSKLTANVGDMQKSETDHGVDALRYELMAHPPLSELPAHLQPFPTHQQKIAAKTKELIDNWKKRQNQSLMDDTMTGGYPDFDATDEPLDPLEEAFR